ncbi:MAG TPA: hypothetical protein VLS45_05205, partial [Methylomicrobium sp.]|nr:hypothetical protein [Methylomicrobium sp.]
MQKVPIIQLKITSWHGRIQKNRASYAYGYYEVKKYPAIERRFFVPIICFGRFHYHSCSRIRTQARRRPARPACARPQRVRGHLQNISDIY